jgi:hypothetical protein
MFSLYKTIPANRLKLSSIFWTWIYNPRVLEIDLEGFCACSVRSLLLIYDLKPGLIPLYDTH